MHAIRPFPVLAFLVTFAFGMAPAAAGQVPLDEGLRAVASELASTLEGSEIQKVAVVEFQDINGYPSALGPFIVEELVTQLFAVRPGQFEIVERRQLARVLREQQLTASGLLDEDTISEIGKLLGIQAIVTGSIADLGTSVRINARAIAVETARVFAAASTTIARDETVQNLLRQAASPQASANATVPRPSGQPADVYFQNDFLQVSVSSFGLKTDEEERDTYVTLSLVFENLTSEDLLLADMNGCTLQLIDDQGTVYDLRELAGLRCVYPGKRTSEDYSSFGPASRSTVVAQFRARTTSPGASFSLAGSLHRFQDGRYKIFSLGISGIRR